MDLKTDFIDYAATGYFSRLVIDYIQENPQLRPFYRYASQTPDFEAAMAARRAFPTDRKLLVGELKRTYGDMALHEKVSRNIELLSREDTFTVCTAHQPNLFTGYLYFVYKVLHAIRLAARLQDQYPGKHFVPVYYMGSEDADLEELGTVHIEGVTYRWQTAQQGAVGRMKPEGLAVLIDAVTRPLGVGPFAREITALLKQAYLEHPDIQSATLFLVNALFGRYGLVVVNADTPGFKRAILPVLTEELTGQTSHGIVSQTIGRLSSHYHPQATPREINLFYLEDQLRERILREGDLWRVLNTSRTFTGPELEQELQEHPERFSPNVILRGLLQETILPDIAFIGGGGELAYWLELQDLFARYGVPYPVLMLRHSVLWVDKKSAQRLDKTGLAPAELFGDTEAVIAGFVKKHTRHELVLKQEYEETEKLYAGLEEKASAIDLTLKASVAAERKRALCSIGKLEHKFLRAEKKTFAWQAELIRSVKQRLFPAGSLQERVDNLLPYYAAYGPAFLDAVYERLDGLNKAFLILESR
jgi:bacillithiol biosynthesis cysteine-adding enzyme BshC